MKNKYPLIFICGFIIFFFLAKPAHARLLPRFSNIGGSIGKIVSSNVIVTPRLRKDRSALLVYFGNLKKAKSVFYTLVYDTNGSQEGVSGSIDSSQDSLSREILFGTCSTNNVCKYHTNISNMKFEVVTELLSGKKTMRRFKIRV
jgi:hypothetical protein